MMKDRICNAFPTCITNNCIETVNNKKFQVRDNENTKKSEIVLKDGTLTVHNPNAKDIDFIAIDSCILQSNDPKKCDCALFDEKEFYFVEFKTFNSKKNNERRGEANQQLESILEIFRNKKISFEQYELIALICFNFIPTRPIASTRMQYKKIEFWNKYKANLLEGNEIMIK